MSRLAEFAVRYAALRAAGAKRIQAAKQAARDVRAELLLVAGRCAKCRSKLGPLFSYGLRPTRYCKGCDQYWVVGA